MLIISTATDSLCMIKSYIAATLFSMADPPQHALDNKITTVQRKLGCLELAGPPTSLCYPDTAFVLKAENSNYCKTEQWAQIQGCVLIESQ